MSEFSELVGKTLISISPTPENGVEELFFETSDGERYRMWHDQDCCESVSLYDADGDIADLLGSPVLQAEEVVSGDSPDGAPTDEESQTWTFYKLATIKGFVTLRWWGTSNGYYSESVSFSKDPTP